MSTHRQHDRDDLDDLIAGLAAWDADGAPVPGLHVGDVGWALRDPDDVWTMHGWWDGGTLDAAALFEGPLARPRIRDQRRHDPALAVAVADVVERLPHDHIWCDAPAGSALADVLGERGWVDCGDPWACLHLDLRDWAAPSVAADEAHTCVADRVAVQVAGFDGSTFTEEKWGRMASGPAYRRALDLVVRDTDGVATAVGTAWLGVPGGTAILEPVATHRDHRRAGHGTRVVHALAAACRDEGATGLTVWTPCSNEAAVQAYRTAGLTLVHEASAMELDRSRALPEG